LKKGRGLLDAALTPAFDAISQALHAACHKDFVRSLNVKSMLTIGNSHPPVFPEAAVHASTLHWVQALMPLMPNRRWRLEIRVFDASRSDDPRVSPSLGFDTRAVIKADGLTWRPINYRRYGLPINRAHPLPLTVYYLNCYLLRANALVILPSPSRTLPGTCLHGRRRSRAFMFLFSLSRRLPLSSDFNNKKRLLEYLLCLRFNAESSTFNRGLCGYDFLVCHDIFNPTEFEFWFS